MTAISTISLSGADSCYDDKSDVAPNGLLEFPGGPFRSAGAKSPKSLVGEVLSCGTHMPITQSIYRNNQELLWWQ